MNRCEACPIADICDTKLPCDPTPESRSGLTVDEMGIAIDCLRAREQDSQARAVAAEAEAATQRERAEIAETDALTQLRTYPTFLRDLKQHFSHKPRASEIIVNSEGDRCRPMLVIFADGNEFGQVNKRYGHDAGDEVIKSMARPFWGLREGDLAARRGGDENIAAVFGLGYEEASALCARVSQDLAEGTRVEFAAGSFVIYTASMAAVYQQKVSRYSEARKLIEVADAWLIESKRRAKAARQAKAQ